LCPFYFRLFFPAIFNDIVMPPKMVEHPTPDARHDGRSDDDDFATCESTGSDASFDASSDSSSECSSDGSFGGVYVASSDTAADASF
jgi:hypothetical protein